MVRAGRCSGGIATEVSLDPMTDEEFVLFLDKAIAQYAEENLKAGYWLEREARERSAREFQVLLPEGLYTKDNFLFTIRDKEEGQKLGSVWLKLESSELKRSGFIYEIVIEEDFRGRGYGTEVMKAIERVAREGGVRTLGLHVFASNIAALRLYQKSGYEIRSMNMIKDL